MYKSIIMPNITYVVKNAATTKANRSSLRKADNYSPKLYMKMRRDQLQSFWKGEQLLKGNKVFETCSKKIGEPHTSKSIKVKQR